MGTAYLGKDLTAACSIRTWEDGEFPNAGSIGSSKSRESQQVHQLPAQVAARELSGQRSVKIKRAGKRLEVHDVAAAKAGEHLLRQRHRRTRSVSGGLQEEPCH